MTIHIVIPVHNHVEETLHCLASLRRQTLADWVAIVVDDGSTDGTAERVAADHLAATVLSGDGQLWWSGATALGVDHALARGEPGDFVLFLNNDTEVDPDYLDALVHTSETHGRAVTGSLNVDADDPERVVDAGTYWDWARVQARHLKREPGASDTTEINTLSGRGMLVPVEVFQKIGNVAVKALPQYYADYEFACRAARAGFLLAVSYDAIVRVHTSITGSEGDLATPRSPREVWSLLLDRRSVRNIRTRFNFIRLACPPRYRLRNWAAFTGLTILLVTNIPPLFQIKNALFRLLPGRKRRWLVDRRFMVVRSPAGSASAKAIDPGS